MKRWIVLVVALVGVAANTMPAWGDGEPIGSLSAQVTVAAPCLMVSPAALDFGVLGFSSAHAPPGPTESTSGEVSVTSCSAARENVFARGENAKSTPPGVTWTLVTSAQGVCPTINRFATGLVRLTGFDFETSDVIFTRLESGEAARENIRLTMPCAGSDGAGTVMGWSYIFTGVLA